MCTSSPPLQLAAAHWHPPCSKMPRCVLTSVSHPLSRAAAPPAITTELRFNDAFFRSGPSHRRESQLIRYAAKTVLHADCM